MENTYCVKCHVLPAEPNRSYCLDCLLREILQEQTDRLNKYSDLLHRDSQL